MEQFCFQHSSYELIDIESSSRLGRLLKVVKQGKVEKNLISYF